MRESWIKRVPAFFSPGLGWLWISALVIGVDRYTKCWVLDHLIYHEPVRVFSLLDLTLSYNTGAAFSFLHRAAGWQNAALGSLALVVSMILLNWLRTLSVRERWLSIALCLILGGALANAWDRLLYGHVVDFISVHWGVWYFAIFNAADSAICLGAFMLFCHWFLHRD